MISTRSGDNPVNSGGLRGLIGWTMPNLRFGRSFDLFARLGWRTHVRDHRYRPATVEATDPAQR